ncbi:hypothetical protein QL285_039990 [Trifolium repens]|nr:hypothetical protein QL285_062684 [Trifolium repens]KAK2417722.1 hypothetical protein QL285_039990 [Trifolium repens]
MTANGEMGNEQNKKLPDPPLLLLEVSQVLKTCLSLAPEVSNKEETAGCLQFALLENRRIYANEGSSINNHALTLLEAATANFIWQLSFNISTFGAA